ncbi:MAG: 3-isopropylmalate dehydratase small subunit [Candidatus Omnitrophica bacterium]|nr:3-isopropylmalate dehydratase small subunit [Candidatus Omnitrophota bacterium]
MKFKGYAHTFGNDVNTDEILPARYLHTIDPQELASHCMEDADPHFVKKVKPGDMIVAGDNFGCGSSREHAPFAIKASGVSCVIAASFARIFYRNAINIGLPILVSKEAASDVKSGDALEIDTQKGLIKNITKKRDYISDVYPEFIQNIIKADGLMNYIRKKKK